MEHRHSPAALPVPGAPLLLQTLNPQCLGLEETLKPTESQLCAMGRDTSQESRDFSTRIRNFRTRGREERGSSSWNKPKPSEPPPQSPVRARLTPSLASHHCLGEITSLFLEVLAKKPQNGLG